jgi:hypothetical protein
MNKPIAILACLCWVAACDTTPGRATERAHTYEITNSLVPGEPSTIIVPAGCRIRQTGNQLEKVCD